MQKCAGSKRAAHDGFLNFKEGTKGPALCPFYFDIMVLDA